MFLLFLRSKNPIHLYNLLLIHQYLLLQGYNQDIKCNKKTYHIRYQKII